MEILRRVFDRSLVSRVNNEKGQTVIEYVLVIALIAIALVLAFQTSGVMDSISHVSNFIAGAISGGGV